MEMLTGVCGQAAQRRCVHTLPLRLLVPPSRPPSRALFTDFGSSRMAWWGEGMDKREESMEGPWWYDMEADGGVVASRSCRRGGGGPTDDDGMDSGAHKRRDASGERERPLASFVFAGVSLVGVGVPRGRPEKVKRQGEMASTVGVRTPTCRLLATFFAFRVIIVVAADGSSTCRGTTAAVCGIAKTSRFLPSCELFPTEAEHESDADGDGWRRVACIFCTTRVTRFFSALTSWGRRGMVREVGGG